MFPSLVFLLVVVVGCNGISDGPWFIYIYIYIYITLISSYKILEIKKFVCGVYLCEMMYKADTCGKL